MSLRFEHCRKVFGRGRRAVVAVADLNLTVEGGELFILLGPSGCGKSTILNLCAGLEQPSSGRIVLGERVVADAERKTFLAPAQRDVAMVFQSYALYPHLSVFGNIAFPLRIAKRDRAEIRKAVQETASMLGIGDLLERRPAELSGGQRQRVAMARALVRHPALFLLDEPLSNLDAQLRTSMRAELKNLQRRLGVTTVYVTHDQVEAMTLGDRIALLRDGALVQVGTPQELYEHPATPFAATFIGSPPMSLLDGRLTRRDGAPAIDIAGTTIPADAARIPADIDDGSVQVGVRPERIELTDPGGGGTLPGTVSTVESLGREMLYHAAVNGRNVVVLSNRRDLKVDQPVGLRLPAEAMHVFQEATKRPSDEATKGRR